MRSSKAFVIAALAGLTAAPVMAGGIAPVVVDPAPVVVVPVAPAVADWTGFYGGLSYGQLDGEFTRPGLRNDLDGGTNPGLFLGYNMQSGNLVYGAELGYTFVNDATQDNAPAGEDGLGDIIDLSGRVGYAFGNALIYGRLGYSMANYDFATRDADFNGISYGLGADFLVTDNIFLGLDYTQRDLEDDTDLKLDASTFGLRVGYKF